MKHEEKSELVNMLIVNYLRLDDEAKKWFNNKINPWISVKDRLPIKGQWVLLFDGIPPADIGRLDSDNKYFDLIGSFGEKTPLKDVTHWMPLPEPPDE